ncbi:MAG TPA: SusC/RagA family TonB-linked outer membrane protein [Chitinophagaceae bacterium]
MLKSLLCLFFFLSGIYSFAQTRTITGSITDAAGKGVPGASVTVKGSTTGTATDNNGQFSLAVPAGKVTLVISAIGYSTQNIDVADGTTRASVSLATSAGEMETVVVTALGISKKSKTLTYSTQTVSANDLSTVKNTNVLNSLNGKVAGVQVNRTSGGAGGSVRVVLRGDKSTRNSQPLYVVDGLPIINPTGGPDAGLYNGAPDAGDILSTINPDDIESINVLKGPSASALYGSQGSNGVILITTKKGKSGTTKVDFSSSVTIDKVSVLPKLQYDYNQTGAPTAAAPGTEDSWGAKGATQPGKDYVKDFFQTGVTFINSISLSSGTDKSSNYLSYSNTDNKGILPTSSFNQNTISFRQSSKLLNDKLVFDGTFLGSIQKATNRLTPGIYYNPLTGLYLFPRGLDFDQYKNYEYFSQSRYLNAQDWWNINYDKDQANGGGWGGQDYQQNPYWTLHRNPAKNRNQNVYASVALKYALNNWLTVQARGNINNFINEYQRNIYATTQGTLARPNGNYSSSKSNNTTLYGDLLLSGNKQLNNNWSFGFTVGTSIQDQKGKTLVVNGSPTVPNVFLESALDRTNISITNDAVSRQIQSVFGSLQFGYKDKIFIDLTDRNDWSSTLAFTPTEKKGYNYYSAGVSAMLSELVDMPTGVNFAKLRISYAQVGNDIASFSTFPLYTFNGGIANPPTSTPVTTVPGLELKPEKNKSFEIGTQWAFMQNRLSFDLTWYNSNITEQYFRGVTLLVGTGTASDINAGKINNTGIEASLSYKVKESKIFGWTTTLNFSHNKNKIKELFDPEVVKNADANSRYALASSGGYVFLKQGGSFGDIYGRTFQTSNGSVVVDGTTHLPVMVDSFICNPNPKSIIGWNNSFNFGNFTAGVLIDGKFGGKVLSITEGYLDQMGVSERSGAARDNGGTVTISNAVTTNGDKWSGDVNAQAYYKHIGGKTPAGAGYIYDATAIRLRELSLSYRFPLNGTAIKSLQLGIIGNNLFFFKKDAPFDPEQVAGVNAAGVGIDAFGLPAYRSVGLSLKCSF